MLENLNLGTETLLLLGLGAGGFMFGPKKGGMASLAKLASIGLLGLGVGNATGIFTLARLKGMIGLNNVGAFEVTAPYTPNVFVDASNRYGYGYGYSSSPYGNIYQYQQQVTPYIQQPQIGGRDYDDVFLFPNLPATSPYETLAGLQYQQYYQQPSYSSYSYYPAYQYQQQTYYSPRDSCIQRCNQYYY